MRYAGLGFLEKNRDTLTDDLIALLQTSEQVRTHTHARTHTAVAPTPTHRTTLHFHAHCNPLRAKRIIAMRLCGLAIPAVADIMVVVVVAAVVVVVPMTIAIGLFLC